MARFVVLEPEGVTVADAVDRAQIVRDGFAVLAFLVPPLWLAWHRLWVEAAVVLAVLLALGLLGDHAGLGSVGSLLSVLVGLEGRSWLIARLRRRGWQELCAIDADHLDEAELRYAAQFGGEDVRDDSTDVITLRKSESAPGAQRPLGPALGLFGYPGAQPR